MSEFHIQKGYPQDGLIIGKPPLGVKAHPLVFRNILKRHLPRGVRYYACTYEPLGVTRANWYLEPHRDEANVLKNWDSIPESLALGQLEDIVRDGDCFV